MFTNRKKIKIQGFTAAHKRSLIRSQVLELVRNGQIKTTTRKAKLLKASFDKLVTLHKRGTTSALNKLKSDLGENKRTFERFDYVVTNFLQDRNSGYTRVIKTLNRKGDNAEQSYVALVNFEGKEKKSKIAQVLEKQAKAPKKAKKPAKKDTKK
jgi:large subunit ribosomal protein L17